MSKRLSRCLVLLFLSCPVLAYAAQGNSLAASQPVNRDAQIMQDFNKRVKDYVELRNKLKEQVPPLKETKDPGRIQASQEGLAAKMREARRDARPGEILTPETRQLFRRLMYPELKGPEGENTREALKEDAPKGGVPLKVNAKYPDSAPLPTVPPNLLAALPKLPEDVEYRVIGKDLILLDVHANLIVDYTRNVIR